METNRHVRSELENTAMNKLRAANVAFKKAQETMQDGDRKMAHHYSNGGNSLLSEYNFIKSVLETIDALTKNMVSE